MKNNKDNETTTVAVSAPMDDLMSYHQQLEEKYKGVNLADVETDPNTKALMAFNGYYGMNSKGAFFTVDTNMYVNNGAAVYDISLIVSLDGITSTRIPFTGTSGTFDGTHLELTTPPDDNGCVNIKLTFKRVGECGGVMASFFGTIVLPKNLPASVNGTTYNNPISYDMYIGSYHTEIFGLLPCTTVMSIEENYVLKYDYNSNLGVLFPVPTYSYNLNMYFFSFSQTNQGTTYQYSLIMGTSAGGGLVCNNITTAGPAVTPRSLQVISFSDAVATKNKPNLQSEALAQFSGYYPIKSTTDTPLPAGAFVAIQGQYITSTNSDGPSYMVSIGISLDGKNSTVYTFDTTMTFSVDNTLSFTTLSTPAQLVSIQFTPGYIKDGDFGSLVTISGSILGTSITGQTPLNPVPLKAFGGAVMTNDKGEALKVTSNSEVIYTPAGPGVPVDMKDILYIPLMYILAYPPDPNTTTTVMSFGTNGTKGNACIITDVQTQKITVVYAIPS